MLLIFFSDAQIDTDTIESRSFDVDSDNSNKAAKKGIKMRRKKQQLQQQQQQLNLEENVQNLSSVVIPAATPSPMKKMQRKKIPIILQGTITSTTTTTQTPNAFIPEDGAFNRTEEDSRCKCF